MHIVVTARAPHFDHVHHVLSVRIFLLPQVQQFEFLPHRRVVTCPSDIAERAEGLLCAAVLFRVCEALVLLNLG